MKPITITQPTTETSGNEITQRFSPLTTLALAEILGLTVKRDDENKLTTFFCMLAAYTDDGQFNISFNAPSSTGKSFLAMELARLFPKEDRIELGYCSPTAFFHDTGKYDEERGCYVVDLSQKILTFLDQPHNDLLARLRPLFSHDEKEIEAKITDKTQKSGLRAKKVILRGFPSVIFATAGLKIDEQEGTRFLLLSPEASQEKIRESVLATIRKEADSDAYDRWLAADPARALLKERILAIKAEGITKIGIASPKRIEERFFKRHSTLKPRNQRDIKWLIALIKSIALLNLWWRERRGTEVLASDDDIDAGFTLWESVAVSQQLNLPPYVYDIYAQVILPAWKDKNALEDGFGSDGGKVGISRQDVLERYYEVYGNMLGSNYLRQQILPMLETAGLITQEQDASDKRKMLIMPLNLAARNSEQRGGVND